MKNCIFQKQIIVINTNGKKSIKYLYEIFFLFFRMDLLGLFAQARFGCFCIIPLPPTTPLSTTEHDQKEGDKETEVQ